MAFELPEAVTISRQMNDVLPGKCVRSCEITPNCASLIRQSFINLDSVNLSSRTVISARSKGKWIFLELSPNLDLCFAIETGGKILFHTNVDTVPGKYHIKLRFTDDSYLTTQIVGWGFAKALEHEELEIHNYPGKLGLSPIDSQELPYETFLEILRKRNQVVKQVITDQRQIAGIGNGYAQEILYRAKIHPKRKTASLDENECRTLYQSIFQTLDESISAGGSELEVDLYNRPGGYRRQVGEHRRGDPCPRCGAFIEKISVLGSSVYLCPGCQKE